MEPGDLRHYERLEKLGRIAPAGRAAFGRRDPKASGYSFESRPRELPPALRRAFQANAGAWAFFTSQASFVPKDVHLWVVSAKQEITRERRLARLIADSAEHRAWACSPGLPIGRPRVGVVCHEPLDKLVAGVRRRRPVV